MKTQQSGFTLIELVIVIVILGILAAVAIPKFQDLSSQAESAVVSSAKAAINSTAAILYAKAQAKPSTASIIDNVAVEGVTITASGTCGFSIAVGGTTTTYSLASDFCEG